MTRTKARRLIAWFCSVLFLAGLLVGDPRASARDDRPQLWDNAEEAADRGKQALERYRSKKPLELQSTDSELTRLKKRRYNHALVEFQSRYALWVGGKSDFPPLRDAHERLLNAELALTSPGKARLDVYREHMLMAKTMPGWEQIRYDNNHSQRCDLELVYWWATEIEIRMATNPPENANK